MSLCLLPKTSETGVIIKKREKEFSVTKRKEYEIRGEKRRGSRLDDDVSLDVCFRERKEAGLFVP